MVSIRRAVLAVGVSALCAAVCGCALLDSTWRLSEAGDDRGGNPLRPIPKPREAITVEIRFIERPAADPLVGESLWREVDQLGALRYDERLMLQKNGIRVGVAASHPPRTLQSLLGLSGAADPDSLRHEQPVGRQVVLPSGAHTEIQSGPLFESCSVAVPGRQGIEVKDYENARFVFRVKAERLDDGWAKLEFIPEIHHGESRLRYTATSAGFAHRTRQNVVPLYGQRFEVDLNLGEMAVITADGREPKSLGRHFFLSANSDAGLQHVLVVRLAEMTQVDPVRSR